jgi:hypothetical protein
MARYATLSAVGARPPTVDANLPPQEVVALMIAHLRAEVAQVLPDHPDLVVLPEVCDLPANYDLYAESTLTGYFSVRGDQVLRALAGIAREHRCHITYPAVRRLPDGTLRNSIQLLDRRGDVIAIYDKYHPTLWEIEAGILPGDHAAAAECDFGRVGFAICFDLNFDEIRARTLQARPDVLAFCSMYHGGLMQNYWAYAGRMHFAGAVTGTGGYLVSPVGAGVAASTNYHNYATARVNLDCAVVHLDYNWERLKAMRAKYGTRARVADPGYLGSVLVSSETDEFTVDDLIREFALERLDDYFARATAIQTARRPAVTTANK